MQDGVWHLLPHVSHLTATSDKTGIGWKLLLVSSSVWAVDPADKITSNDSFPEYRATKDGQIFDFYNKSHEKLLWFESYFEFFIRIKKSQALDLDTSDKTPFLARQFFLFSKWFYSADKAALPVRKL
ncbi:MAG: hypothetical protein UX09_C0030G0015 [Candidatus Uhrbacteria bacterium GW2011_GWE2_45_35]|uniref:Uncharacterized protein n=2 Tax=Candidatus Uhriibacteriota TaxID=1752732 RepID=A0A0G1JGR4_9BACT|nr:MAG: hypothetical protein UW63_C0024G0002 [Candidatus Uhrbacteria bacterium GW2011_GWF2_44_350]KKU07421.1 MAG: hypothetical protein UX09_C0030G0015 [Candidatus Uhrbacteria bacterium GW2011_GWE2_45_35]